MTNTETDLKRCQCVCCIRDGIKRPVMADGLFVYHDEFGGLNAHDGYTCDGTGIVYTRATPDHGLDKAEAVEGLDDALKETEHVLMTLAENSNWRIIHKAAKAWNSHTEPSGDCEKLKRYSLFAADDLGSPYPYYEEDATGDWVQYADVAALSSPVVGNAVNDAADLLRDIVSAYDEEGEFKIDKLPEKWIGKGVNAFIDDCRKTIANLTPISSEKDGNAYGVEEDFLRDVEQAIKYAEGEPRLEGNVTLAFDWIDAMIHASRAYVLQHRSAQTPPVAGWQGIADSVISQLLAWKSRPQLIFMFDEIDEAITKLSAPKPDETSGREKT